MLWPQHWNTGQDVGTSLLIRLMGQWLESGVRRGSEVLVVMVEAVVVMVSVVRE